MTVPVQREFDDDADRDNEPTEDAEIDLKAVEGDAEDIEHTETMMLANADDIERAVSKVRFLTHCLLGSLLTLIHTFSCVSWFEMYARALSVARTG